MSVYDPLRGTTEFFRNLLEWAQLTSINETPQE
jgi:hypothetical protein